MRRYLPRPHQVVLLIGFLAALGTFASGIAPELTGWHHDARISREVFVNIPPATRGRLLPRGRHRPLHRRLAGLAPGPQLRAGQAGQPPHEQGQLRAEDAGLPVRRLDAHAPAGPGRGHHALVHLLRVPGAVRHHGGPRDRPPAARVAQVPPRPDLRGLRVRRRPLRPGVHHRDPVGARPPLRPAALPHPDQDQARAPGHPRHVPRHRRHRVHHRGAAHRGPACRDRPGGELREVVVRRLGALARRRRLDAGRPARRAPVVVDRPRGRVPRLPRDPPDHDAAPHDHEPDEHVPEGPAAPEGRDARDAEPDGDRARDVRRLDRRGLHVEAALRHRRVHDLRPLHLRLPGPRDRQAAGPARDRAQDRRGDDGHGLAAGVPAGRHRRARSRSPRTACSSGSRPRSSGPARRARRATRSARSTSRSSTRSSTCAGTSR